MCCHTIDPRCVPACAADAGMTSAAAAEAALYQAPPSAGPQLGRSPRKRSQYDSVPDTDVLMDSVVKVRPWEA